MKYRRGSTVKVPFESENFQIGFFFLLCILFWFISLLNRQFVVNKQKEWMKDARTNKLLAVLDSLFSVSPLKLMGIAQLNRREQSGNWQQKCQVASENLSH